MNGGAYAGCVFQAKKSDQVRRWRKITGKQVETSEGLADTSGASLIYAGYPYDPYDPYDPYV